MNVWVWIMGLWLVGIGTAAALDVSKAENLRYGVYWGFLNVGDATLSYTPSGQAYTLRAEVRDDSALIDLHDVWQSEGSHTAARAFVPAVYKVVQVENAYRSDKTMVFDRKAGKVVYTNHLDATDVAEPLPLKEARDVLATVYAWRVAGETDVTRAARVPLVSLKREIVLDRKAGVLDKVLINGRNLPAWRVEMRAIKAGKPARDLWTVYVSNDAARVPLKIVAATKFGTFTALLKK